MQHSHRLVLMVLICLLVLLPEVASATIPREAHLMQQQTGIEFKVAAAGSGYAVYARPNATPSDTSNGGGGQTLTAQVTVRVAHAEGADRVEVSNVQSAVEGVFWQQRSRTDAPAEDPDADYISFEYDYMISNLSAIQWATGQEVQLFTFETSSSAGDLSLMENCNSFMAPNSANTNPGNQIAVKGLNINNAYIGNYDVTTASACSTDVYLPLINR
ncbi:MAG: hypothetical protein R3A44_06050 [Caldilineaceae bacterium]